MAKYQLLLPKMGESVAEATVIKWNKNPGDRVDADEAVMEIATDKVDSDVPSPVAGRLIEQLYQENDVVQVGAIIAIIETDEPEHATAGSDSKSAPEVETTIPAIEVPHIAESAPVDESQDDFKEYTPFNEVRYDAQPPVVENQEVAEYQPDVVAPADIPGIAQLEPQAPSPYDQNFKGEGRFYSPLVRNIASQENISIDELDRIPGTGSEGRLTKDDLLSYIQYKNSPVAAQKEAVPEPPFAAVSQTVEPTSAAAPVESPVTEKPAAAFEPEQVKEPTMVPEPQPVSGPETVSAPKAEVPPAQPASSSGSVSGVDEVIEMDRMRRLIADHMVMSKQTSPHVTSFVEADVTGLVLWREKVKGSFEKRENEKITFTPIFIEAVVKAIKDFPMINVTVNGTQIIKKAAINISMATALPSGNLIVPVIKKADELNLLGITKAVNDLANRARTGKLLPDDVRDGTFTITNVGSFGNVMGTPIINQPQVAILAVGAIKKKPAVIETPQGDVIAIRHMMFLSLSYDHRVVDGALGGSFVRRVADYLEKWDANREI
ncbi:2-oxo acid dehydrogenase subunit E2 [Mucilaginibacter sp. AW1-7]|uniref:dihydrolipoamide acetyltransferase family protein n=1 Tax=Mucilaginibacter sp. AW1-7 TaxID=3349874 RepID=UPI003F731DCB